MVAKAALGKLAAQNDLLLAGGDKTEPAIQTLRAAIVRLCVQRQCVGANLRGVGYEFGQKAHADPFVAVRRIDGDANEMNQAPAEMGRRISIAHWPPVELGQHEVCALSYSWFEHRAVLGPVSLETGGIDAEYLRQINGLNRPNLHVGVAAVGNLEMQLLVNDHFGFVQIALVAQSRHKPPIGALVARVVNFGDASGAQLCMERAEEQFDGTTSFDTFGKGNSTQPGGLANGYAVDANTPELAGVFEDDAVVRGEQRGKVAAGEVIVATTGVAQQASDSRKVFGTHRPRGGTTEIQAFSKEPHSAPEGEMQRCERCDEHCYSLYTRRARQGVL